MVFNKNNLVHIQMEMNQVLKRILKRLRTEFEICVNKCRNNNKNSSIDHDWL